MKCYEAIIIGAGPTGLGAAWRLAELGSNDWLICEQSDRAGGLASSFRDENGYLWDFAVHVAHSHYDYFDNLMQCLLPDGFYSHQRKSWVRLHDSWVPYPFQYNFRHLPERVKSECLEGLRKVVKNRELPSYHLDPVNFYDWILKSFGEGIARHFMLPYNQKIWTEDLRKMSWQWLGERVPTVEINRVEKSINDGLDDVAWGPNATFHFPKKGATGAIWNEIFARLPRENKRLLTKVVSIDSQKKIVSFANGEKVQYKYMISSLPLPVLAHLIGDQRLAGMLTELSHSRVQVVGVGVRKPIPEELVNKTWIYCPEDKAKFYRVTPFSIFSPDLTPNSDCNCSFLCEFATPGLGAGIPPFDLAHLAVEGLRNLGIIDLMPNDYHTHIMHSEYGYPVPTLNRDSILNSVIPALEMLDVYSRGRFGGWKYEVANMDHCVMQGVEVVNRLLLGQREMTWATPHAVNMMTSRK